MTGGDSGSHRKSKPLPLVRQRLHSDAIERQPKAESSESSQSDLLAALVAKDTLIRELRHRLMNNLQVVSSLLTLRVAQLPDGPAKDVLDDCALRIGAMALVHHALDRSDELSRINLGGYLVNLVTHLQKALDPKKNIVYATHLQDVTVDADEGMLWGLIFVELVTNVHKHAFREDGRGHIEVRLVAIDNSVQQLVIADDGVGQPPGCATFVESTGLELVRGLAGQLEAGVEITTAKGTTVAITRSVPLAESGFPR